jgi:hypothetical protein
MFAHLIAIAAAVWAWLRKASPIPIGDPTAPKISGKLLCPCFASGVNGRVLGVWDLLGLDAANQDAVLASLKRYAARGEIPMAAFLLTPNEVAGKLFVRFPDILDEARCATAEAFFKRALKAGVALAPTLYCDDPDPRRGDPCWFQLADHKAGWRVFFDRYSKYFSAVFLSVETNERAASRGQVDGLIDLLRREVAPGLQAYGTHLDWGAHNVDAVRPGNADLILFEGPWLIARGMEHVGDARGVNGVRAWIDSMKARGVDLGKAVIHEFNMRPDGEIVKAQRDAGREAGLRGVGG